MAAFLSLPALMGLACSPDKPAFDGERAFADLEKLCAIGPRFPGSPGHEAALAYIVKEVSGHSDRVEVDRWSHTTASGRAIEVANVTATFGPREASGIAVAAHWDTRPVADKDPDPARRNEPILGANDGASGTAVLLELARCLGRTPPRRRVDLVFLDGEDYGDFARDRDVLIGSRRYASRVDRKKIRGAIVVDMVGDRSLQLPLEEYSARRAPELASAVYGKARELGYGGIFTMSDRQSVIDDHIPILDAGIQAIDIIDLDYAYWHTTQDTPDKCSARSLAVVGRVVVEFLRSFNPEDLPPSR